MRMVEVVKAKGHLALRKTRVAAQLLHKEPMGIQGACCYYTFYLQNCHFIKWSRGDSNP